MNETSSSPPLAPLPPEAGPVRSRLIFGCMRMGAGYDAQAPANSTARPEYDRARSAVATALALGITKFDHADIYGKGSAESLFPMILKDLGVRRGSIVIQSKCGMIFSDSSPEALGLQYDFSYGHILRAVDDSLRRLATDYLDILLLHRPDALMEPEEIARAFDELQAAGKVRQFGVSNHNPAQMELLRHHVRQPIVANQMEIHLLNTSLLDAGLVIQGGQPALAPAAGGTLEYCRAHGIGLEAWSPLAGGRLRGEGRDSPDPRIARVAKAVAEQAASLGVEPETVAIAWLLRHPAKIRPVLGTLDPARLRACAAAEKLALTREQWYRLYAASRGKPLH